MIVAHGEFFCDVVEDDSHSKALGHDTDLATNMAVTDDAKGLASDFVTTLGRLVPLALMQLLDAIAHVPSEYYYLRENQLGDASGVGEGRIEYGNTKAVRGLQIDLVCADTEATDAEQMLGRIQYLCRDLGLAAKANDVNIRDALDELGLAEGTCDHLHFEVVAPKKLSCGVVDILEKENLDLVLRKRSYRFGPSHAQNIPQ